MTIVLHKLALFKQGTEVVCKEIATQPEACSVIGGGDSAAAAIKLGFEDKFTHISIVGITSIQDK